MEPAQQVARLGKLIERLGNFPDRDVIHQVTETAKVGLKTGGMELAERMTACVMDVLDDAGSDASPPAGAEPTAAERRVPLFYAMDSVVKNVGDVYGPLFGLRVKAAFEKAFAACHDKDKTRLHHVLRTWNEKKIFVESLDDLNALVAPWHAEFAATAVAAATAQAQAQARQQQLAAQHAQKLSTAALAAQRLEETTDVKRHELRQWEIHRYLERRRLLGAAWVALDDEDLVDGAENRARRDVFVDRAVLVRSDVGLADDDVRRALEILGVGGAPD